MKKVMIAVPCMDYLEANFVECLTALLERPRDYIIHVQFLKGCIVYDARNQLTEAVLKNGTYDYVWWIDSDMTFPPDTLERMLNTIGDKPLLCGLCFGRRPPFNMTIYDSIEIKKNGVHAEPVVHNYENYPRDSVFEIAGCGFACVLQRTDMMDAMSIYGVPFFPLGGLGEDLSYCFRANELGYKMYCDSSIKPGHLMRIAVDENFKDNVVQNQ